MAKESRTIAIIGGGFSGLAVATALLHRSVQLKTPLSILIFDPNERLGAGIAYGTRRQEHLLNVVASKMSLVTEEPDAFALWLNQHAPQFGPDSFAPRALFWEYLRDHHAHYVNAARGISTVTHITQEVIELSCDASPFTLITANKERFTSSVAILAMGNLPQAPSGATSSLQNLWFDDTLDAVSSLKKVAIVGTGLTAVDTILSLEKNGFAGHYSLISRHGTFPRAHHEVTPPSDPSLSVAAEKIAQSSSLKVMLSSFREEVRKGADWRTLIDALRPHTQGVWKSLTMPMKRSFLNRLRNKWEIHRHRVPVASISVIEDLQQKGRLEVRRGKLIKSEIRGGNAYLTLESSSGIATLGPFDNAYNCLGLGADIKKTSSALVSSLLRSQAVTPDAFSIGLSADEHLRVKGKFENSSLYVLGPLLRGELWETTAAREIREQAKKISETILQNVE